ncbi:hypothetical protein ACP4OV_013712 [Aristida adscensionis]
MAGPFQLNPDASPFIPASLSSFADKTPEKQAESSSKGGHSGNILDLSQYEETDMDPLALANSVFSMFPNVSTDFIDELLKANDFDINLTIDMIQELYSHDKLHDDAELGFSTFSDGSDLRDGQQGIPCGDNHRAESSSHNQALQNEKPATSDAKPVPATFPKTNSPHKDLGLPDDNKSMGSSAAN